MTRSSDPNIQELLDRADELPYGREERELLQRALDLAGEAGDEPLEYRIRLALIASYGATDDETEQLLMHFSVCAAMHERDPVSFPAKPADGCGGDLLWYYKWVAGSISESALFEREQIEQLLAQMERHYRRAGAPLGGVIAERLGYHVANGFLSEAERDFAELTAMGRDQWSDCPACAAALECEMHLGYGRELEALVVIDRIMREQYSCGEEPESVLSRALGAMLRAGRLEAAKAAHLAATREQCRYIGAGSIGDNMAFCAMTGNASRGLGMLARALPGLVQDPIVTQLHFRFLVGAAILLEAVVTEGHGEVEVPGSGAPEYAEHFGQAPAGPDGEPRDFTAELLAQRTREAAMRLAERYDERNGNDFYRWRLETQLEQGRERFPLALGAADFSLQARTVTRREPADDAERLAFAHIAVVSGDPQRAMELLDRDMPGLGELDRSRLLAMRVRLALDAQSGSRQRAGEVAEEYWTWLESAGHAGLAAFYREMGLAIFDEELPEDLPRVRELVAKHRDAADPLLEYELLSELRTYCLAAGELEAALDACDSALAVAGALGHQAELEVSHAVRMIVLARLGRVEEAAAVHASVRPAAASLDGSYILDHARCVSASVAGDGDGMLQAAERLIPVLIELGMRRGVAQLAGHTALALASAGRGDEAVERQRLAVEQVEAAGGDALEERVQLGRVLTQAGQSDRAIQVLGPIMEPVMAPAGNERLTVDRELSTPENEALFFFGHASEDVGEPHMALALWHEARDHALRTGNEGLAIAAMIDFGRLAVGLEAYGPVEEELRSVLPLALALEDKDNAILLLDWIAVARAELGDAGALDDLAQAAELVTTAERRIYIDESMARSLGALGRIDEGVARWLSVSDQHAEVSGPDAAAASMSKAADLLASAQRPQDAAALFEQAAASDGIAPMHAAQLLDRLAEMWEQHGEPRLARQARKRSEQITESGSG